MDNNLINVKNNSFSALMNYVDKIKDFKTRGFTKFALLCTPDEFWLAPSSSSGKYHPPEDNGAGGLVRHTIKAAQIVIEFSEFHNLESLARDIVLSAMILHDIKKGGEPWEKHTDYTHGLIACNWLSKIKSDISSFVKELIKTCVRYHMARWVQPESELKRALKPNKLELIVQQADYLASRKNISFFPGVDIQLKKEGEENG